MEISKGIEIRDLFLYIKRHKSLVIGDAHLGYEESLRKQGFFLPKFQFKEIMARTEEVLKETKPQKIIVVGDLKHEFGTISKEEWKDTLKFIDLFQKYGELILIKGNHDTILKPIADKRKVKIRDYYVLGKYYFCHGHRIPEDLDFQKAKVVVIGHEHPAVGLKDGPRTEKYKCFLRGKFKGKEVLVLPSLSSIPEGTDILKEKIQSPFLQGIKNFEVFVIEDKPYKFGKVKDI